MCTPAVLTAAVGELVGLFVPFVILVRAHVRTPQLPLQLFGCLAPEFVDPACKRFVGGGLPFARHDVCGVGGVVADKEWLLACGVGRI